MHFWTCVMETLYHSIAFRAIYRRSCVLYTIFSAKILTHFTQKLGPVIRNDHPRKPISTEDLVQVFHNYGCRGFPQLPLANVWPCPCKSKCFPSLRQRTHQIHTHPLARYHSYFPFHLWGMSRFGFTVFLTDSACPTVSLHRLGQKKFLAMSCATLHLPLCPNL